MPHLADTLLELANHHPHWLARNGRDELVIRNGGVYRLGSLAYADEARGLLEDLMTICDSLGIVVTISRWATLNPMFTAFGSDKPGEVKWRHTGKSAAWAVAGMMLDAETHPESPRVPSELEVALEQAASDVRVLRSRLVAAEQKQAEILTALEASA